MQYYSIGQMASMCQVSVQALRYYDRIGLLRPAEVKPNGYRYYSASQIVTVRIIQQMQTVGFSLSEVNELLAEDDLAEIIAKYRKRYDQLEQEIKKLQQAQLQLRLQIGSLTFYQNSPGHDLIELRHSSSNLVAFTRCKCPCNPDAFAVRFNELQSIISNNHWKIRGNFCAAFYDHYRDFDYQNADIEVFVVVDAASDTESPYLKQQPAYSYISALHQGPYETNVHTFQNMLDWARDHGYQVRLPSIERYIVDIATTNDPKNFVTELQLPVENP